MKELRISRQITNRETYSLNRYLLEISKIEMVTPDEEADLSRRIRQGDQAALEKLTKANLRFVVSVAKKYQNFGMTLGDLINEGNLGLVKAAQKFDETRGFKFISYAVWWIRQAIIQSLTDHARIIRLPINKVNDIHKIQRSFALLEQQYQREPTAHELAHATGISSDMVSQNQTYTGRHRSLDTPFQEGEATTLLDVLPDPDVDSPDAGILKKSLQIDLLAMVSQLTCREREVIVSYYGLDGEFPLRLEELAERFNLSKERVRQIRERAISRLKRLKGSESLKSYL